MSWVSRAIQEWLTANDSVADTYWHTTLAEEAAQRQAGLAKLAELAADAHRDARERLEKLVGQTLDPLAGEAPSDWRAYPDELHTSVLQGYLGELLAGVIAENYRPHGRAWLVPAFLFRGHNAAFEELERQRQLGGPARPVPGRTGDDALAFEVGEDASIVAWLWGEAKCTHDHSAALIADAHEQLSKAIRIPVSLVQLIEVLGDSQREDRDRWIAALRELLYSDDPPPRYDLCVYVCGRKPVRRPTWITTDAPHPSYTATGPLQAVEVHFDDFDGVLVAIYPGHTVSRA
jgi:hypothetical protein